MQIVLSKESMRHEFTGKTHSSSQELCWNDNTLIKGNTWMNN